jgi:hypothetical protein
MIAEELERHGPSHHARRASLPVSEVIIKPHHPGEDFLMIKTVQAHAPLAELFNLGIKGFSVNSVFSVV